MKVLLFAMFCIYAGAWAKSAVQENINGEGPNCPIDDPLNTPDVQNINAVFLPIFEVANGSYIDKLIAQGLSTYHFKVNIGNLLFTTFEFTIDKFEGSAGYSAYGILDASPINETIIPSGFFRGNGTGTVTVEGLHIKGTAQLSLLNNTVRVYTLTLQDASFSSLTLDFGQLWTIGGEKVDWGKFNANIKAGWDSEFAAKKTAVSEKFRVALNSAFGAKYTLEEVKKYFDGGEPCP